MTGKEAESIGWANKAIPADKLEEEVNRIVREIAKVPVEILALEKATVNRVMDIMGFRSACFLGAEYDAMARVTEPARKWVQKLAEKGVKETYLEWSQQT